MKKTIIALMALAGVAMADDLPITLGGETVAEQLTSNGQFNWDGTVGNLDSWEVSFDITPVLKKNETALNEQVLFSTTKVSSGAYGVRFSVTSDGTVMITDGSSALKTTEETVFTCGTETPITISFVADYTGEDYTGGTFTVTSGEKTLLTYEAAATLEYTALEDGYASVWTQSGNGDSSCTFEFRNITVSQLENNVIPSATVPEPATATLSLLALAGLAARRRRK